MYCTNPKLPSQMVRIQRRTVRIQQRTVQPRGRTVRAYRRTIRVSNRMVRCIVFKEDCYLNPHPSQQNFPSYPMTRNTIIQHSRHMGVSTFRPIEGRKETVGPMNHIGQILICHKTQTNGGKTICQYPNNLTNIGPKSWRSPTGCY